MTGRNDTDVKADIGVGPQSDGDLTSMTMNQTSSEPALRVEMTDDSSRFELDDFIRRTIDVTVAFLAIVFISPLLMVISALVWLQDGGPPIYAQERMGRGGKSFKCYKFRSMVIDSRARLERLLAESPEAREEWARDHKLRKDPRITALGGFLRQSSLDELPQLVSVLVGDMSLVGPRPLPLRYTQRYSPRQATRLQVRPGLTGWAQIHGRNGLDWPARLELDARYVEMLGTWYAPIIDVWILIVTFFQVAWQGLTGRGVTAPGAATMREFLP